jgi:hypothetical protein
VALAFLALGSVSVQAADEDADANAKTKTVWIDGKGYKGFADKVNKTHAEMTANGWKFSDLEIYTENGDMQGAFATYERD